MKQLIVILLCAFLSVTGLYAQEPVKQATPHHHHHHGNGHPHHHDGNHQGPHGPRTPAAIQYNADGIQTDIVEAFPTVKKVVKKGVWNEVLDAKGKRLGYVVFSKPASDGVKGFNGETPVMIAFDAKKVIKGVYQLPNIEGGRFLQSVSDAGLYKSWNGLTVKQAKKKTVETVSGATFTSRAVIQSVQKALEQL
ncbi:MAG: FMN-binding protein [Bacteroidales bacterium]|nr:FMN-binding protein [Bacteroidales bacterium]